MTWPNRSNWGAELQDQTVITQQGPRFLWTQDCGELQVPSGRLVACDPFAAMQAGGNPHVLVPPGCYPVSVTLADVSAAQDRSHIREAYATVRIAPGVAVRRQALPLAREGDPHVELAEGEYVGFPVDAGTACFVDDIATATCMPDPGDWYDELFESGRPDSWFSRMDDPGQLRAGLANIVLPLARAGENILIVHSGWGDGHYPVVGSFDVEGRLLAVHIDFGVVD